MDYSYFVYSLVFNPVVVLTINLYRHYTLAYTIRQKAVLILRVYDYGTEEIIYRYHITDGTD